MLVDTHTHVISNDFDRYPLRPRNLSGEWYKTAPHTAEQLLALMDRAGVEKAVLVQPVGAYTYDNAYAADSAAKYPDRFTSACAIDAEAEDAVDTLTHWIRERGMNAVRLFAISAKPTSWLDDPRTFPVWERALELGASIIVTILFHQLPQLERVLSHFGTARVCLDHCAFPPLAGAPWAEAQPLCDLARFENLHCKVSSNALELASRGGGDPRAFVEHLSEHFGAARLHWGSDFSQTHDRPYGELVELGRRSFSGLGRVP